MEEMKRMSPYISVPESETVMGEAVRNQSGPNLVVTEGTRRGLGDLFPVRLYVPLLGVFPGKRGERLFLTEEGTRDLIKALQAALDFEPPPKSETMTIEVKVTPAPFEGGKKHEDVQRHPGSTVERGRVPHIHPGLQPEAVPVKGGE